NPPPLCGMPRSSPFSRLRCPVLSDDLGTVAARIRLFDFGRVGRHHDEVRQTAELRRRSYPLSMVAGGVRHHPALGGRAVEPRDAVPRTSELERAGALK